MTSETSLKTASTLNVNDLEKIGISQTTLEGLRNGTMVIVPTKLTSDMFNSIGESLENKADPNQLWANALCNL